MTFTPHTITAEQVKLLIHEGESLSVEFKERYTPRIDEGIAAFANAKFFRAIFQRSPEFAMKAGISRATEAGKNIAQKSLAIIGQKPEITRQELGMELGITDSGVKYHLKKLQEQGRLRRIGPDKGGHWEVTP